MPSYLSFSASGQSSYLCGMPISHPVLRAGIGKVVFNVAFAGDLLGAGNASLIVQIELAQLLRDGACIQIDGQLAQVRLHFRAHSSHVLFRRHAGHSAAVLQLVVCAYEIELPPTRSAQLQPRSA
jgi:hypothetical protein